MPVSSSVNHLNFRIAYGALAYDANAGYYFFENDTLDEATLWTVASKAGASIFLVIFMSWLTQLRLANTGCYWYTTGSNTPCYCEKLPSQQFPAIFWSATQLNSTYQGSQCYNGQWSLPQTNGGVIDQFCFSGPTVTYVVFNGGGEDYYLKIATFNSKPSPSLFVLRNGCHA